MPPVRAIRGFLLFAFCLLLAAAPSRAQLPSTNPADNAEAASMMQQARDYEASGDTGRAIGIYRAVVKRYAVSPSAPAAQFRLAELIEQSGNRSRAFDAYKSLVENYPQSREFDQIGRAHV